MRSDTHTATRRAESRRRVDLVVAHGYVVTMDEDRRVFADGAVAVSGREIVMVGSTADVLAQVEPMHTIDAAGGVVHPGFVECHTHVTYHLARAAFRDTVSYAELPQRQFTNAIDDDAEYASTLLACLEMIGNGTTCFIEAGTAYSPAAVAAAAETIGMRGLVADPFLWDVDNSPSGKDSRRHLRAPASTDRSLALLGSELYRNRDPHALVGGHIAIVGMGTASDQLQRAAKAAADAAGTVFNQHQSYSHADTQNDDQRYGGHPLIHLEDIGALGNNCLLAHANIIREDEVDAIIRSGLSIAWCPAASMLWGVGGTIHGRHAELYNRGVNIGLGSDSANWSNRFDLGLQSYLAVATARERCGNRDVLIAEDTLTMATVNGARAVGLDQRIGSLVPGKRADIVVRANDVAEAFPLTNPILQMVYSAGAKSVHTVLIDGRVVLKARRPTRIEAETVFATVQKAAKRTFEGIGYRVEPKWTPC